MALRGFSMAVGVLTLALSGVAASAQQMPCGNEIGPLRAAVEKDGAAIKAAIDKKAGREEVCNRLKRFAATEAKFVKYVETNASWCGVPPQAVQQLKQSHTHTLKMRGQACAAGPAGGQAGPPPGPGLSEALGTSRTPTTNNNAGDRGTYNSLTGNVLAR
jgi:hypothetical protein